MSSGHNLEHHVTRSIETEVERPARCTIVVVRSSVTALIVTPRCMGWRTGGQVGNTLGDKTGLGHVLSADKPQNRAYIDYRMPSLHAGLAITRCFTVWWWPH